MTLAKCPTVLNTALSMSCKIAKVCQVDYFGKTFTLKVIMREYYSQKTKTGTTCHEMLKSDLIFVSN